MASASPQLARMSEAASTLNKITAKAHVSGESAKVLAVEDFALLQPCCIQFSPYHPDNFVVGTYNLEDPKTQTRNGDLLLYEIYHKNMILVDEYTHTGAITDIKFSNPKCHTLEVFAIASSTGDISVFKVEDFRINDVLIRKIVLIKKYDIFPHDILVTSLAWLSSPEGLIVVTLSSGEVYALRLVDYRLLHQHVRVLAHTETAWTVAFGMDVDNLYTGAPHDYNGVIDRLFEMQPGQDNDKATAITANGIYSGGDDSRLRFTGLIRNAYDGHIENGKGNDMGDGPVASKDIGGHNAGVVAILPLPFRTMIGRDILLTGSFDDHVRVYTMFDHRFQRADLKPKILADCNLGGGVWRLEFMEDYAKPDSNGKYDYDIRETTPTTYRVLATCMHGGAHILEVTGCLKGDWTIKVVAELQFNTDNDLVYAGAVQPPLPEDRAHTDAEDTEYVCVSANFYAKQLCLWTYIPKVIPLVSQDSLS